MRTSVIDGIPTRLRGVRKGATTIVKFVQKCCHCGLKHDVKIEHENGSGEMDVTFNQKGKDHE